METILKKSFKSSRLDTSISSDHEKKTFTAKIGYLSEKPGAEMVLNGDTPNEWKKNKDLDLFLGLLKYPRIREYIAKKIHTKAFIQYWRKAKEKTSSSFSGIQFGHYI